jgi:hypothetical protein
LLTRKAQHQRRQGINVDTVDGRVTLHGKRCGPTREEDGGRTFVAKIDGAREVRNLIQVVPENRRRSRGLGRSDPRRVKDAFKKDSRLASSGITCSRSTRASCSLAGEHAVD